MVEGEQRDPPGKLGDSLAPGGENADAHSNRFPVFQFLSRSFASEAPAVPYHFLGEELFV